MIAKFYLLCAAASTQPSLTPLLLNQGLANHGCLLLPSWMSRTKVCWQQTHTHTHGTPPVPGLRHPAVSSLAGTRAQESPGPAPHSSLHRHAHCGSLHLAPGPLIFGCPNARMGDLDPLVPPWLPRLLPLAPPSLHRGCTGGWQHRHAGSAAHTSHHFIFHSLWSLQLAPQTRGDPAPHSSCWHLDRHAHITDSPCPVK